MASLLPSMIALGRSDLKPPDQTTILARMNDTPNPRRRRLRYGLMGFCPVSRV